MHKTVVAMFTYNRPEKFQSLLSSFHSCSRISEIDLVIFCDGQKKGTNDSRVIENQDIVRSSEYLIPSTIIVRETNIGLAQSIIRGVSELLSKYEQIIVLEDDLVLHPDLIHFMLSALERYKDDKEVFQISGYNFPVSLPLSESAFFLPFISSWGWATWADRWKYFKEIKANDISFSLKERYRFDLYGAYPYYSMLCDTVNGKVNSWAVQWYYAVFRQHGLALYPTRSLVDNNGFDGSGVHCGETSHFRHEREFTKKCEHEFLFPREVVVNQLHFSVVRNQLSKEMPLFSLLKYSVIERLLFLK